MRPVRRQRSRKGAVLPLVAILMVFLLAMVAFSVDIGYMVVTRQELQNAADSGALAGARRLPDYEVEYNYASSAQKQAVIDKAIDAAKAEAKKFAQNNSAGGKMLIILDSDIEVGYIASPASQNTLQAPTPSGKFPNAVRIKTRRDSTVSTGPLRLFFAPVIGVSDSELQSTATAFAESASVVGFRPPGQNKHNGLLPVTVNVDIWNGFLNRQTLPSGYTSADGFTVTLPGPGVTPPNNVTTGTDTIPELLGVYPDNNAPGNFGLIDIGPDANDAPSFWDWFANGASDNDIKYLAANRNGASGSSTWKATPSNPAVLKGGPGLKASDESYIRDIIGQQRILPLFSTVSGNGQNTTYDIVGFAGVTIVDVQLNGNNKYLRLQPTATVDQTTVTDPGVASSITRYVYRPVSLVK